MTKRKETPKGDEEPNRLEILPWYHLFSAHKGPGKEGFFFFFFFFHASSIVQPTARHHELVGSRFFLRQWAIKQTFGSF